MNICPITLKEARGFVRHWHRHHGSPQGGKFAIGLDKDNIIVGVAIVGRPLARRLDDGWTAEVIRCCVQEGHPNGCSMLYGAAWRAARGMGYKRLITYTLPEEGGASLRGAGWRCVGEAGGGTWNRVSRPRADLHPQQTKLRWEAGFA